MNNIVDLVVDAIGYFNSISWQNLSFELEQSKFEN